jgi:hypothetical protein
MIPESNPLEICKHLVATRRHSHDWVAIVAYWLECKNQHRVAERFGIRQSHVSRMLVKCGIRIGKGNNSPKKIHLPVDTIVSRYLAGESTIELGSAYGVDPELIRARLSQRGIKRRGYGQAKGHKNYQWKGGREQAMHYHRRQAYEVAAICLGQPLPQGWIVHHADENPTNNDPSNLMVFESQKAHAGFHQQLLKLLHEGKTVDASQLALRSGAQWLPPPPAPLVLPPCKVRYSLSKKGEKPFWFQSMLKHKQKKSNQQPEHQLF